MIFQLLASVDASPFDKIDQMLGEGSMLLDVCKIRVVPVQNVKMIYGPKLGFQVRLVNDVYVIEFTADPVKAQVIERCPKIRPQVRNVEVSRQDVYATVSLGPFKHIRHRLWVEGQPLGARQPELILCLDGEDVTL